MELIPARPHAICSLRAAAVQEIGGDVNRIARRHRMYRKPLLIATVAVLLGAGVAVAATAGAETFSVGGRPGGSDGPPASQAITGPIEIQSLDGTDNNLERPNQGAANTPYPGGTAGAAARSPIADRCLRSATDCRSVLITA
jgi:hypothetical protein